MAKELDANQVLAVNQLKPGSILCGGVGSGKSRTALAFYYNKICGGGLESIEGRFSEPKNQIPLYIITIAVKRDRKEWDNELSLYCLSTDESVSIEGIKVTVDSWNNIQKYTEVENSFFIFDEQRLVSYGAWVKAFFKIAKNNKWILLSATPGDNWMDYIPVFIANGFYRNKTEFVARHVVYKPYRKFPVIDHYMDVKHLERLRSEILVNIVYSQTAEYSVEKISCSYDISKYDTILEFRIDPWTGIPIKNISEFSYKLKKTVFSSEKRIETCTNAIKNIPKIIIFYNFDYELEILRQICTNLKVEFGERNGHKHESIPKSDRWVFLVQYASGAEGWNCIETNYILFYSPSSSYKIMKQASGRIDRRNTPFRTLNYLYLKSDSDIEKRIYRTIKNKKEFNDRALSDLWDSKEELWQT